MLPSYCKFWMLKIDPKKTKTMIFQNSPRKCVDIKVKIDNEPAETVQKYTYLETRLTPNGNVTLALDYLKDKAMPFFSVIRKRALLSRIELQH